jgi:beta-phosphoglucomutase
MRAVLFDFDGVIVNSEPLHFRAMRDCLVPEGITIDEEEYAASYLAYDDREAIRVALERHGRTFDRTLVETVALRKAGIFDALIADVPFFPGARELVRALAAEMPIAIASGALRSEIVRILAAGGLQDAFTTIVGADDVTHGKPNPEPYLMAMKRLGPLTPADCLVIEDSVAGIAAGRAAGMKVLAVTHTYPAAKLTAAHRVVDGLAGLTPSDLRGLFRS